jgi:hypothetical protein
MPPFQDHHFTPSYENMPPKQKDRGGEGGGSGEIAHDVVVALLPSEKPQASKADRLILPGWLAPAPESKSGLVCLLYCITRTSTVVVTKFFQSFCFTY